MKPAAKRKVKQRAAPARRTRSVRNPRRMNRNLLISSARQHKPTGAAQKLNDQLRAEIAHRQTVEDALREKEAWQRLVMNHVEDFAIFSLDTEGRVKDWNTGAEEAFGFSREEILGRHVAIVFTPEDRAAGIPEKELIDAEREGCALDERWHLRKNGGRFFVSGAMRPLRDRAGKLLGFVKVVRDITNRKQAEEALRASEERFRALFELGPVAVYSCDAAGVIQEFNRRAAELLGGEPAPGDDEERFCHSFKLFRPDGTLMSYDQWPKSEVVTGKRAAVKDAEVLIERPDGSRITVVVNVRPLTNERGEVTGAISCFYDITERKQAEETVRQAKDMLLDHAGKLERVVNERTAALRETVEDLEAFCYSITHDLRAPLRSMQGFATMLKSECGEQLSPAAMDYLRRIMESAGRMDKLITDVLAYSRVLRTELKLAPVDLDALLRGILESYPTFQPPCAEIAVEGTLPKIMGNEAALTQCFSNLLGNAVKFVVPGTTPQVRVWAETDQERVRVFIQDNGIGIPAAMHERIFGIFEQLSRQYEGTGIGLAIVRKAITRMGGTVGLKSEPAKGSTFWIELAGATEKNH